MAAISDKVSTPPQNGDGTNKAFAFDFSIIAPGDIGVYVDGIEKDYPDDYGVVFGGTSGTVTFHEAPAAGTQILLVSQPDYSQTSEFADQSAYNLSTVNTINRRAAIRDLVLKKSSDRALKFPRGSVAPDMPALPTARGVIAYDPALGFVWTPNDTVTVASDLLRSEQARASAEAAAAQASADRDAIETLVAQQPQTVAKPLDESVTSSTVLVTDADLMVPLAANSLTVLNGHINYSAGATGDLKWQHAGPAAPVSVRVNRQALAPGDTAYGGIAVDTAYSGGDIAVAGGAGRGIVKFEATIRNGPTPGNFAFKWAQNSSDATPTKIEAGSRIEYFGLPASADFAFASSVIAKLGNYIGPVSSGGHNVVSLQTAGIVNSYIETVVEGSTVSAQLFTGNYTVTVDGGAPFVVAGPAGNTWGFVPLFSGLEDEPHRLKIQGIALDSDTTLRVVGYGPNLVRPSDVPNRYRIYDAAYNAYIAKDGAPDPYTGNYGTGDARVAVQASASGFGVRFSATTTSVRLWIYDGAANSRHILLQDGVAIGNPYTTDGSGIFKLVTLATGLSGTHEYEIQAIHSGRQSYIFALFVDTLDAVPHSAKPLDVWYGDSNVEMQIGEDARTHASYLLARATGKAATRKGLGGQKVSTWGRDNTALVTSGLSQAAGRIINMIGVNDYYFSTALATLEADYTTMLANQRSGNASAPIICLGIHDHYRARSDATPYLDADRILYNNRIAAAVAARVTAGDSNVFYVDTSGWIDGTNPTQDLRDGVHLNATGWIAFESHLAAALAGLGI